MALEAGGGRSVNISQAAKMLKVTEKTIRNYIEKGLLGAEKWNGAWRVDLSLIEEFYWKKYGKKIEINHRTLDPESGNVELSREIYDQMQKKAGKLEAQEELLRGMQHQVKELTDRISQLEASSAAGWTEARKYKEDIETLKNERTEARQREIEARTEAEWLRKELQKTQERTEHAEKNGDTFRAQVEELRIELGIAREALQDRENRLQNLRTKYRRDSFLD